MTLRLGEKIKALRLTSDLTQEELANRAGLSKGFISQLENDQTSIQIDSLAGILGVFGVSLSEFFSDVDEAKVVYTPSDRISVDSTGASRFELLVPGSTNNLMDPIMLELQPGDRLEESDPQPGEQFGYVLRGTATLRIDRRTLKVPSKHCFYFKSDMKHQIVNESGQNVALLWVTSPPRM